MSEEQAGTCDGWSWAGKPAHIHFWIWAGYGDDGAWACDWSPSPEAWPPRWLGEITIDDLEHVCERCLDVVMNKDYGKLKKAILADS